MPQLCFNCFHAHDPSAGICPHCGFDLEQQKKDYPIALTAGAMLNNRYYVGRVLGQGGFGITYVALDTNLNAKVAIKEFMPSELATRLDGRTVSVYAGDKTQEFDYGEERFLEEARTLAQFIGNPNIAGVSNYFTENETSYFVMDYIEGISFKAYIAQQGGTVPLQDALNVMVPVLNALSAVHQAGFIHRDVTPDNIFITKDGGVKLLDFGSARYSVGDRSKSLDVILKVGYAPKEQYIRRGRQGPFTDVYSCAACLYACLTGFLPPESLERLDQDALVPVSQVLPEIPQYINNAILKGLAVNAEDRFQSAQEFLDAIESQTVVQLPTKETPVEAPKKKNTVLIATIAGVVVLGCVGMFALGGGGSSSDSVGSGSSGLANLVSSVNSKTYTITIGDDEVEVDGGYLTYDGYVGDAEFAQICQHADLTEINLWDANTSNLSDISPVSALTDLIRLDIGSPYDSYNNIQTYAPIQNLTQLKICRLGVADATDVEYLSGLTELTQLQIYSCTTTDLSWMSGMTKLEEVLIYESSALESLAGLEGKEYLSSLELFDCNTLTNVSALSSATNLKSLRIYEANSLEDLSPAANCTSLTTLYIWSSYGTITDISFISNMVNLKDFQMCFSIADLSYEPFRNLTALTRIYTYNDTGTPTTLSDLSPLAGLTELAELTVNCNIKSLAPLANLTKLVSLETGSGDTVSDETLLAYMDGDLSALANLTELRTLSLRNYNITDLTPVASLSKLTSFTADNCNVTDISPLAELSNLRSVYIYSYSEIENKDVLDHITGATIYDRSY